MQSFPDFPVRSGNFPFDVFYNFRNSGNIEMISRKIVVKTVSIREISRFVREIPRFVREVSRFTWSRISHCSFGYVVRFVRRAMFLQQQQTYSHEVKTNIGTQPKRQAGNG